jgi:hypothetical protein
MGYTLVKRQTFFGGGAMGNIRWFQNADKTFCVRKGIETRLFADKEEAEKYYLSLKNGEKTNVHTHKFQN